MKQTLEQAAIEAVENHYGMDYDGKIHEMYILREAFEAGAEWQKKQSPWISVKEEKPPQNKVVFVYHNGEYFAAYLSYAMCDYWWGVTFKNTEYYLIHDEDYWMPIPSFNEIIEDMGD